jgi:hypothetical protein
MASLRSILRKALKYDPLTAKLVKAEKDVPGSVGAGVTALTAENVSSDPFGPEQSRWDIFAGGEKLSQDPENRALGRTIGSLFAGWYGAGAAGAGASTQATVAAGAVQLSQGAEAANLAQRIADEEGARQRELIAVMRGEQSKEPAAIPLADEAAMRRQRRRSMASIMRRRGRQSTILTGGGGGDALGA